MMRRETPLRINFTLFPDARAGMFRRRIPPHLLASPSGGTQHRNNIFWGNLYAITGQK